MTNLHSINLPTHSATLGRFDDSIQLIKSIPPYELRLNQLNKLADNGFSVIPVQGKIPFISGWQNKKTSTPEEREQWAKAGMNIGILAENTPAIDIDIRDEALALHMQEFAAKVLGVTDPVVRIGSHPKRLMPCRADIPFSKMTSKKYKSPDGLMHQVEILGKGQQFVAYGLHPDTGKPYHYPNAELIDVKSQDLPLLSPRKAEQIITEFETNAPDDWEVVSKGKKVSNDPSDTGIKRVNRRGNPNPPDVGRIKSALKYLDASDHEFWCKTVGMGLHKEFQGSEEGFQIWLVWSRQANGYGDVSEADCRKRWNSFNKEARSKKGQKTIGSVFYAAKGAGWDSHADDYQTVKNTAVITNITPLTVITIIGGDTK